jgi:hypothetical protein
MNLSRAYFLHAAFYDNALHLNYICDRHHICRAVIYGRATVFAISETRVRQRSVHAMRTLACMRCAIIAERAQAVTV